MTYANLFLVAELHGFRNRDLIVGLGYQFVEFLEVETSEIRFLVALGDLRFQVHEALEATRRHTSKAT
jgi:hypothetical protein